MNDAAPRTRRIEVLLILLALAIAAGWFVGVAPMHREWDRISTCSAHLRGMSGAFYIYAEDGDLFPWLFDGTRAGEMAPFAHRNKPPSPGDIPSSTADMWTLVQAFHSSIAQFNCPSTTDTPDPFRFGDTAFDFAGPDHLSYAYVYQYHPQRKPLGTNSDPVLPLIGDANPYVKGALKDSASNDRKSIGAGNSRNHRLRKGQCILFVDGHAEFIKSPVNPITFSKQRTSPQPDDNIYTTHADNEPADPGNAPTWTRIQIGSKSDYCLVP